MPFTELLLFALAIGTAGLFAGLTAGLFGVGGGMVIVPVMVMVFKAFNIAPDIAIHIAIGTSLATILPTSITSLRTHDRHGALDRNVLRQWAVAVILGSALGGYVASMLPGRTLSMFFGFFALAIAAWMALSPAKLQVRQALPQGWAQQILASIIGFISAVVGIGGGSMSVPTLVLCGTPIHRAVGTASAIGFLIALPATLIFMIASPPVGIMPPASLGHINLLAFALLAPTSMLAAPYGARLAHKLPPLLLRRIFASYLLVVAVKMVLSS